MRTNVFAFISYTGNSLFLMQWSQGGDMLHWGAENPDTPDATPSSDSSSDSSSSSSPPADSPSSSSSSSSSKEEWIHMLSADDEPYRCSLPKSRGSSKERSQVYDGPSPLSLLKELFQKGSCSYRIESYWTYEVCHGKYVRQVGQLYGIDISPNFIMSVIFIPRQR